MQPVGLTERVGGWVEEFGKEIQFVKNCNAFDTPALAPEGGRGGLPTLREYRRTLHILYVMVQFGILSFCTKSLKFDIYYLFY